MAETQKINKLIIETGGVEYELDGGGGSGPLGPDTVGTDQIIDGAVQLEDLNQEVIDKLTNSYDPDGERLHLGGNVGTGMEYGNTELNDDPASLMD